MRMHHHIAKWAEIDRSRDIGTFFLRRFNQLTQWDNHPHDQPITHRRPSSVSVSICRRAAASPIAPVPSHGGCANRHSHATAIDVDSLHTATHPTTHTTQNEPTAQQVQHKGHGHVYVVCYPFDADRASGRFLLLNSRRQWDERILCRQLQPLTAHRSTTKQTDATCDTKQDRRTDV